MQIREETIKAVLKLERKMEQTEKFDPLLGWYLKSAWSDTNRKKE